ncbi:hypothetical protein CRUP_029622 [Coryphaenoides rupestris]|nr:hypothetical protein CRUP_029622 [Coryphaenoides rupestris]
MRRKRKSLFPITGAILLAVGVWGKLMLGPYISLIADNSTNAPYVLIGTGTVIVVFGLCCLPRRPPQRRHHVRLSDTTNWLMIGHTTSSSSSGQRPHKMAPGYG